MSRFSGNNGDTLNKLRLLKNTTKFQLATDKSNQNFYHPLHLQPNTIATGYTIRYKSGHVLPEDWVVQLKGDQLFPILIDKPQAPEELLYIIRCGCTTDCSSQRCSCRKVGLSSSTACGQLRLPGRKHLVLPLLIN